MTYSLEELKKLIPLYLNRQLSEKEKMAFEDGLQQFPALEAELKEFAEIKAIYHEIVKEIPSPSNGLYQRILKNIQPQIKLSFVPAKKRMTQRIWQNLKWIFGSPRVSWGIVAVQFAVILFLLIFLPQENLFKTLTYQPPSSDKGIKINVIFDKESKEKEIMDLLIQAGAIIIRGPSPEGLYIIEIERNQDVRKVLDQLKGNPIVKFSEIAY